MVRIFSPEAKEGAKIMPSKNEQRHIKVLRLREGEEIRVYDGLGNEYSATYSGKVSDPLILDKKVTPLPATNITLAISPAKGNRMDLLVEKATELGAARIIPLICERTVVKPKEGKIERWKKISQEASSQSGRAKIPEIEPPMSFSEALQKVRGDAYICDINGDPMPAIRDEATILVGPEGGFTEKELKKAQDQKIQKIKLANTILRTETAGIAALAQAARP